MKFVDLAFLVIVIPWRLIPVARSRKKNPVIWTLAGIGTWIGTSLIIAIAYAPIQSYGVFHFQWTVDTMRTGLFIARVIGILCSFAMVELLRRRLISRSPDEKPA